ncbi:hypothetical protein F5Y04DRAFT_290810 [Hypomontagnella monticulosa]|nr:hypothetical protein F5Y04DRAFT_290810 [Hypomontagnella monticulosa]
MVSSRSSRAASKAPAFAAASGPSAKRAPIARPRSQSRALGKSHMSRRPSVDSEADQMDVDVPVDDVQDYDVEEDETFEYQSEPESESESEGEGDVELEDGSPPATDDVDDDEGDDESSSWESMSEDSVDPDFDNDGAILQNPPGYVPDPAEPVPDLRRRKEIILLEYFRRLSPTMQNVTLISIQKLGRTERKAVPYWSEGDQDRLVADWKRDPLKFELEKLDLKKNKDILPMWKIVRRFLGCYLTDIINARAYLRYEKSVIINDGQIEDLNWIKIFCWRLAHLVLHGIFQFDQSFVKPPLFYVVICCIDYRGMIPWNNTGMDDFLYRFLLEMRNRDGSMSVVQIHRKGLSITSQMSEFFRCIEKCAFQKWEGIPFHSREPPVFEITVKDLGIVTKAIDAIRTTGAPNFLPLSMAWRIVTSARRSHDAPRDLNELNELRTMLIIRDRRHAIIQRRHQDGDGAEPVSDYAPSQPSRPAKRPRRNSDN